MTEYNKITNKEDAIEAVIQLYKDGNPYRRRVAVANYGAMAGMTGLTGAVVHQGIQKKRGIDSKANYIIPAAVGGALVGGLYGYFKHPKPETPEKARKEALSFIKDLGGYYIVTDNKGITKPEIDYIDSLEKAQSKSDYLNSQGRRTFIVSSEEVK